jgi:DNA end-binding protein Ku
MRSIWSGSISFGLVNIPVRLYSGSLSHEGLDLDMLHKEDQSPIRYARVCRQDGKEIPYDHIVKGYEYQEGDYIVLTKEDFKKADVRKTKTIDIKQFVDEHEIDTRYFEKPYYLEPVKGAGKAYALLREALERSNKVALAKYVLRSRDNMAALKPVGKVLVLNQLRFPADVREPVNLNLPSKKEASEDEVKMALALISQLTKHFVPEDWHDTYTEELEEIIEQKAKGKKPKARGKAPNDTKVKDLMATLKASLKQKQ